MTKKTAVFAKDTDKRQLTVQRTFDAAPELVWTAWTDSTILDQWWAPKPYRAETSKMDCRNGGQWLYAMISPAGEHHYCRVDFHTVQAPELIRSTAGFCNEAGVINPDFPLMHWEQHFQAAGSGTAVRILISFDRDADMEQILSMGFREGFAAGLDNLDDYLSAR